MKKAKEVVRSEGGAGINKEDRLGWKAGVSYTRISPCQGSEGGRRLAPSKH